MKPVIAPLCKRLLANGARPGADPFPVLKLFDERGAAFDDAVRAHLAEEAAP